MEPEPLLTPDESRLVVLPVEHHDIWAMYKKAVASFWVAEEIDLSKDLVDWGKLTPDEKYFISMILAFFAGADGLVNENLTFRFYNDVQNSEARLFYGFQVAMEGIHQEVYANLIDTYITDRKEKHRLFNAIQEFRFIREKANFCYKYMGRETEVSPAPPSFLPPSMEEGVRGNYVPPKEGVRGNLGFPSRLVAFACVEGIMFSGSFCAIYWFKKRGLLKGLTFSNELISRDEALHAEFAILLYNKLKNRLSKSVFVSIIREAVNIEVEFICNALPCRLIGMNSDLMTKYIYFVADRMCVQMGYDKIYNVPNPFDWMELISIESKSNFFENKVSEYALANRDKVGDVFDFNADF
jgi:ribonucleoside-diphosphate reductase subunit M2